MLYLRTLAKKLATAASRMSTKSLGEIEPFPCGMIIVCFTNKIHDNKVIGLSYSNFNFTFTQIVIVSNRSLLQCN